MKVKRLVRDAIGFLSPTALRYAQQINSRYFASPEAVFSRYYHDNLWRNDQSRSGPGSTLEFTEQLRRALPGLIDELDVKVFVDAPCGDFHWMRHVALPAGVRYVGCDVVPGMIADNTARHADDAHSFAVCDITAAAPPRCDLIMCRDCLIHLPFQRIFEALENFRRSGATYLALSHQGWVRENVEGRLGGHRPLNFRIAPFDFPEPLRLLYDGSDALRAQYDAGAQKDPKHLAVWRIADLPF